MLMSPSPSSNHETAHQPAEDLSIDLPGGRKLSYAEFGAPDGIPLFAFHGTPGSRFMFRLVHGPARELGLRIIAPERPGFGHSTFQPNRTLSGWARDVAALADRLGLERFGVAGISGGGPYAAACAALLPGRVKLAALISPVGPLRGREAPGAIESSQYFMFRVFPHMTPAIEAIFAAGRLMFLHTPDILYRFLLARATPSDRRILSKPSVRRNFLDGVTEGLRPGIRGSIQEMKIFAQPWDLPFEAIKAPVLLWQGTRDKNVPVAASLHLRRLIPTCELNLLEGAGHYWIFEHIGEVLKAIMNKLSDPHPR